jgi:flagellar motor switch protein FliM
MKQLLIIIWNDIVEMYNVMELAFVTCFYKTLPQHLSQTAVIIQTAGAAFQAAMEVIMTMMSDSFVNIWSAKTYRAQASLHISGSLLHR